MCIESVYITSENIKNLIESKNEKVLASVDMVEASKKREGFLLRSFIPSLEIKAARESIRTDEQVKFSQQMLGAEAKLNLYNAGSDQIENQIRSLDVQKREISLQRVISEEVERGRVIYWNVIYAKEKSNLLKKMIALNAENLKKAQLRIKSGIATKSDQFEFEMKDIELKQDLSETLLKLNSEESHLKVLLGLGRNSEIGYPQNLSHDHEFENVLKHSFRQHEFLYKEDAISAEQKALHAKNSKRSWWPKLDAYASYNKYEVPTTFRGQTDLPNESEVGVRVTMNLFSAFESQANAGSELKEAEALRKSTEYAKREVEMHIDSEMSELKLLHDQVHDVEENIKRAEQYYKLTLSEYNLGVKNSLDVLSASEKLFDMQNKRLEVIKKFQHSKAHVLSKIGNGP